MIIQTDTTFPDTARRDEIDSVRVMRQIERRAVDLQLQLDRLQLRWQRHADRLSSHGHRVGYTFDDVLA